MPKTFFISHCDAHFMYINLHNPKQHFVGIETEVNSMSHLKLGPCVKIMKAGFPVERKRTFSLSTAEKGS